MAKLIILVGNIGQGKSTYSKKLVSEGYYVVSRDSIRYMINAGNYIFDRDKEKVVHDITMRCLHSLFGSKVNIVLDETNMTVKSRSNYIETAKKYGYEVEAHVMPPLSKEESVQRRLNDNHGTYDKIKWEEVWENFNNRYVEPTIEEGFNEVIKL